MTNIIKSNLQKIRAYRDLHPELLKSHHFTYDLVLKGDSSENYMVMGYNPGEKDSEDTCEGPTEETSEYHRANINNYPKKKKIYGKFYKSTSLHT